MEEKLDKIIALLTEIRDLQREEKEFRKAAIIESEKRAARSADALEKILGANPQFGPFMSLLRRG